MTTTRFEPSWLALREAADADARATDLLDRLPEQVAAAPVVRDLGSGTGAMARWLAARLPGRRLWTLTDHDPELLALALSDLPGAIVDLRDITLLDAADLAGTGLVTGSALLDLLTEAEVDRLAAACVGAGAAALLALSVVGRVELDPLDPLDAVLGAAFNDHQRRTVDGRRLLGPDAVDAAARAFAGQGAAVHRAPSPWHLGRERAALAAEWLRGWVAAACEQRPDLAGPATDYLDRRLAECVAGTLRVTVHHEDLLAVPGQAVPPR